MDEKSCVALFSGGLDSIVSIKHMQSLGIKVYPMKCVNVFNTFGLEDDVDELRRNAEAVLGVPLKIFENSAEMLEMIKTPRYGYGKNMNPCIDCRIMLLKKAAQYMKEIGASYVISGEVLGQRPMSQHKTAMHLVSVRAGVEGLILRPLCAKNLPPTIPEQEGWVDREKLLDIKGRGRKRQIKLAAEFGVKAFPSPAGGCLLTDKFFSIRLRDLFEYGKDCSVDDVKLLRLGRHFRLDPETKVIVGRDERDNILIEKMFREGDALIVLDEDVPSPTTLLRGNVNENTMRTAGELTAAFSSQRASTEVIINIRVDNESLPDMTVVPAGKEQIDRLVIGSI